MTLFPNALGLLLLNLLLLSGCANSILRSYPQQMQETLTALKQGSNTAASASANTGTNENKLAKTVAKKANGPNQLLHYLEQGRLAQLRQADSLSQDYYQAAIKIFNDQDLQAQIDLSQTAATGGAF